TPTDVASAGLWYQWGRKDPLGRIGQWSTATLQAVNVSDNAVPGITACTNSTTFFTNTNNGAQNIFALTEDFVNNYDETAEGQTIERYMIDFAKKNPTKFIRIYNSNIQWTGTAVVFDFLWGNQQGAIYPTMGGTYKSVCDPCPAGYRVVPLDIWYNFKFSVPNGGNEKNGWNIDFQDYGGQLGSSVCTTYRGYNFYIKGTRDTEGNFPTDNDVRTDFYTTTGYRAGTSGETTLWASYIGVWSSAPSYMLRADDTTLANVNKISSAFGFGVRCVKEN
ncbi:MAG: hypothetical protein K2M66_03315, partial [Alistipes sp.]|nr:hypothetical protein [Alistipes sp.]